MGSDPFGRPVYQWRHMYCHDIFRCRERRRKGSSKVKTSSSQIREAHRIAAFYVKFEKAPSLSAHPSSVPEFEFIIVLKQRARCSNTHCAEESHLNVAAVCSCPSVRPSSGRKGRIDGILLRWAMQCNVLQRMGTRASERGEDGARARAGGARARAPACTGSWKRFLNSRGTRFF